MNCVYVSDEVVESRLYERQEVVDFNDHLKDVIYG